MRNKSLIIPIIFSILLISFPAKANTVDFKDVDSSSHYIDNSGSGRDTTFEADLYFPDGGDSSLYSDGMGVFEFDNYYNTNSINTFTITLAGHALNNNQTIEIFLNLTGTWIAVPGASYTADLWNNFTLTMDILNQQLLYNDVYVGDINYAMANFVGIDSFKVGYGCHFTHDSTSVHVAGSYTTPIPEPVTCITLLLGIFGLALKHNKYKIQ